jgi:hypothetical protein
MCRPVRFNYIDLKLYTVRSLLDYHRGSLWYSDPNSGMTSLNLRPDELAILEISNTRSFKE